jgi:hypothetical protein
MTRINEALDQLSGLTRRIHERTAAQDLSSPTFLQSGQMILGPLQLLAEEADAFNDVVATIYELTIAKKELIGLPATESLIQTAIVDGVDVQKLSHEPDFEIRLAAALSELKIALSQEAKDWTVYHEVRGVVPDGLPFRVGKVDFSVVDDSLGAAIRSSKISSAVESQAQGKIFGKATVKAQESSAASLLALKQVRSAVDVVNFFLDVLGAPHQFLFLPGDRQMAHTTSFVLRESRLTNTSSTIPGPVAPMYLGYIKESVARRSGFDRASSLFGKQNRNAFEDRILASIQWAGRAAVDERPEEAFLLFVIALESLLLKKDIFGELRFRFALYGSHLLVKTFDIRKRVFDDLGDAYDKRSQIVHSGSTQVAITELRRIHTYVRDAILAVLLDPLFRDMDEKQFDNWLKARAVGATEDAN